MGRLGSRGAQQRLATPRASGGLPRDAFTYGCRARCRRHIGGSRPWRRGSEECERLRRIRRDLRTAHKGIKTLRVMLRREAKNFAAAAAVVALIVAVVIVLVSR